MLNWIRRRAHIPAVADRPVAPRETHPPPATGKYALLYKYLENRYAETVVLTFAQTEWWTAKASTGGASHSTAWTLASRTASPNLMARTVAFDRPV